MSSSTSSHAFLASLRAAFSGRMVSDPAEMAPWLRDYRQRWGGPALAVVQPDSTADVAAVVRWCVDHDAVIVPQGGNTGLTGASVPLADPRPAPRPEAQPTSPDKVPSEAQDPAQARAQAAGSADARPRPVILLSLSRMQRVRSVDALASTMVVEAGCTLQAAQEAAAAHGLLFPLSLASEGSCTIGGNLATNAGGVQVLRYGNMRELCLGLEVVMADGQVWQGLNRLRKNNTGYDLRDLFIGAEGTLGIITAAVLKLYPQPAGQVAALVQLESPDQALALLAQAQGRLAAELTAFELISDAAMQLVLKNIPGSRLPFEASSTDAPLPWYVLLEVSSLHSEQAAQEVLEAVLSEALADGMVQDAVISQSLAQFEQLWALRENISAAQSHEGKNIKHDISVPISRIGEFIEAASRQLRQAYPDAQLIVFGHLGDGNLHFNVAPHARFAQHYDEAFAHDEARVNRLVHDLVAAYEGAISAEHGIGVLRQTELVRYKQPLELQMMRAIKQALDPLDRMNPGKLLPTPYT